MHYRPSTVSDQIALQQMIQGTPLSCITLYNSASQITFLAADTAHSYGRIMGITTGYVDDTHTLTIGQTYLCGKWDEAEHRDELLLHMMQHAHDACGATHYRLNSFSETKPICIMPFISPQKEPEMANNASELALHFD